MQNHVEYPYELYIHVASRAHCNMEIVRLELISMGYTMNQIQAAECDYVSGAVAMNTVIEESRISEKIIYLLSYIDEDGHTLPLRAYSDEEAANSRLKELQSKYSERSFYIDAIVLY